jgi:hypothetical protein
MLSVAGRKGKGLAALAKAANTLYAAGMRGIDPKTNKLVGALTRIGAETMMRLAAPHRIPHHPEGERYDL